MWPMDQLHLLLLLCLLSSLAQWQAMWASALCVAISGIWTSWSSSCCPYLSILLPVLVATVTTAALQVSQWFLTGNWSRNAWMRGLVAKRHMKTACAKRSVKLLQFQWSQGAHCFQTHELAEQVFTPEVGPSNIYASDVGFYGPSSQRMDHAFRRSLAEIISGLLGPWFDLLELTIRVCRLTRASGKAKQSIPRIPKKCAVLLHCVRVLPS